MARPGTFPPGISGNPGGRPKVVREVRTWAQGKLPRVCERLDKWLESDNEKVGLAAALAILKAAGVPLSEERAPDTGNPTPPSNGKPQSENDLLEAATEGEA